MDTYLHIGRPKVGSSTIQRTLAHNRQSLETAGFGWPQCADAKVGHANALARLLTSNPRSRDVHDAIAPPAGSRTALSSERLFRLRPEALQALREVTGSAGRIVCYLRAYHDWFVSLYFQEVKKLRFLGSIDQFFEVNRTSCSSESALRRWGSVFGRENLRVRHLGSLGGGMVADFSSFLGVALKEVPDQHVSPNWIIIEFVRAAGQCEPDPGKIAGEGGGRRGLISRSSEALAKAGTFERLPYLQADQRDALVQEYLTEAEWLASYVGVDIPEVSMSAPGRKGAPPVLSMAPRVAKDALREFIRSPFVTNRPYLSETLARVEREHLI